MALFIHQEVPYLLDFTPLLGVEDVIGILLMAACVTSVSVHFSIMMEYVGYARTSHPHTFGLMKAPTAAKSKKVGNFNFDHFCSVY